MGIRDALLRGEQIIRTPTSQSSNAVSLILSPCDFNPNGTFTGYVRTPRLNLSIEYNVSGRAFIRGNPFLKHDFNWDLQLDAEKFQKLQTLLNRNHTGSPLSPGLVLEDGFQPTGVGSVGNGETSTLTPPSGTLPEGSFISVYSILITTVSYDWIRDGLYSVKLTAQEL